MCASRPGTAGRPPRGPGPAAPGVVLRVREGTRTRGISGPRVRLSPFLLLFPALRARTLGGSWLQSFRGRRGLRRARRRAGCGRGEARTDALLAASLFRSGGETWRGVSRGGPGLSAATFRARRGLFVPSPISSLACKGIPKPLILSLWGVCVEELGGFLAFSAASSEFSFLRLRVPTHPSALRLPEF